MITYQFSNSNNWQQVSTGNLIAQDVEPVAAQRYYPIPDYVIPVQLTSPILAIYAFSSAAENHWRYAGKAFQRIRTGLTLGGGADSWIDSQRFYLNQITILRFEQVSSTYDVILTIPFWIRQLSFVLLEYTGPIIDSSKQKLDLILERLPDLS
ncbi:MAG: hypothetical protein EWV82_06510 [Microcystis aeruginosa Ma_AC_P_19900807_S299]|jgi:hypothetical protein|nr:MAG: hypothetical protein EWV82_06510 [Microcystis aeruginosa Ma_AC_P_19900807_S299]